MSIVRVQGGNAQAGVPFSSVDKAYGSNVVSGNLLIAYAFFTPQTVAGGVTDSQGNTWTAATSAAQSATLGENCQIFYAIAGSSAANTVTLTATPGGTGRINIYIEEYSGCASSSPQDGSGANGTGASSQPSLSLTTSVSHGLIVSALNNNGGSGSAGSGFTVGMGTADNWWQSNEYKLDSGTAGSQTVTWAGTPTWAMTAAAFKPLAATALTGKGNSSR